MDLIINFDYKIFLDTQINLNSRNLYYNSINNNQDKIQNEKIEKNSSIFNNEIHANNVSNNDFAFIKNSNSFPYVQGSSNNNNITVKANSLNNKNKKKNNSNYKINNNNSNNINNNHNPNFDFFKIYIKKLKIVILKKTDLIIVSFFSSLTKTCIIKNYLLHMHVVYSNFFFDSFENSKIKYFFESIAFMTKNLHTFNKGKNIKNKDIKIMQYTNTQSSVPQVGTETRNINNIINYFESNKYNNQNQSKNTNINLNQNNIQRIISSNNNINQNQIDNIEDKDKSNFFKLMKNIFFEVNLKIKLNYSLKNKIIFNLIFNLI
jgi:hypothetical protein